VLTLLGPAVVALLIGALLRTMAPIPASLTDHAPVLGARLLQVSIVLLGFSVNVGEVLSVAATSLPVMLGTLAAGLAGIWLISRWLNVDRTVGTLLAVGTSICGASAIAAVAPVVGAAGPEIAYAVSVVFVFNVTAVIAFPVIAHALAFSPNTFAVWAGTAVNDTSSVLAAGFAFGAGTATYAAVVKLSRTLMILPVTVGLALIVGRHGEEGLVTRAATALRRALPWFIVAFVGASLINAVGLVPTAGAHAAATFAQLGTILALATIGIATDLRGFLRAGHRPLLLGLLGWILVAGTSLALQATTGLLVMHA
jgi:uncharacterized integral membrane protein (TIGR00698 family)